MRPLPERTALFETWLKEHRGIIVKVKRSFAFNLNDGADLEQEMLLQLWLSLASYAGDAKPSTWIYRVCLNTAMSWRRDTSRHVNRIEPGANLATIEDQIASPADRASERELVSRLYDAIRGMPDFDRVLTLLLLDGLAYREIAEITGLTENHVGVALNRARKRLTSLLKGVTNELG